MFSVDGSMKDEVKYLKDKAILWSDQLRTKPLDRNEAWYALNSSIMRTIHYPLMATSMSIKEIESIMSPLLKVALPKIGVCRNFPRDMAFSQHGHRGLGISDPWLHQGLEKLIILMGESTLSDTCRLLRESVSLCQQQSGLGPNFLSIPFTNSIKAYVTKGIVTSLWEFCSILQLSLSTPQQIRQHYPEDSYIMSKILLHHPSNQEIRDINACRLFLQVDTLSDILMLDGTSIRHDVWNGIQFQNSDEWAYQPSPNTAAWNSWRRYLVQILPSDNRGIFYHPLLFHYWDYSQWKYFISIDNLFLYKRTSRTNFQIFNMIANNARTRRAIRSYSSSEEQCSVLPERCYPCNIQETNHQIQVYSSSRAFHSSSQTRTNSKWVDNIEIKVHGNIELIRQALIDGQLVIVSDGSHKKKTGYATGAYVITSLEHHATHFLTGTIRSTGPAHLQDSYRAELAGILAGIYHLQELLELWQLKDLSTSITFGCDNLSALQVSFDHVSHPNISPDHDHSDYIHCIRKISPANISIIHRHIEGHQDKHSTHLDTFALLNVQMDTLSKQARAALEQQNRPKCWHADLPHWSWLPFFHNAIICKDIRAEIIKIASVRRTNCYLMEKNILSQETAPSVDWSTLAAAMKCQTPGRRRWITKHTVGMTGVNLWRYRWKDRKDDKCPRCSELENAQHVYMCQDDAVAVQWAKELKDLSSFMVDLNTCPSLSLSITTNLNNMYNGDPYDNTSPITLLQASIGWKHFFEGLWHQAWVETQDTFFRDRGIRASARSWGKAVMDQLWAIHFRMWSHRNDVEHQHDHDMLMTSLNNRIDEHISDGFEWLNGSHHQKISDRELARVKESTSAEYKRSWLRNLEALQHLFLNPNPAPAPRDIAPLLEQAQRNITEYFPPRQL